MEQNDPKTEQTSCKGQQSDKEKEPDLRVEIRQYQTLLEILDKPKSTIKVILAIVVLALAIFMALAFTVIAIKRIYPYNEIKTNTFGATTMQNEEVELTYWLFNTADLWANSGIHVKKGDVLTIRASGKSNTSIHHLVDHAFYNARPRYEWTGTEGEPRAANTRTAFKIYSNRDPDALIMQVLPDNQEISTKKGMLKEEYLRMDYIDSTKVDENCKDRFYYIGKERTNLMINQEGILYFAVNDIVLTPRCIDSMARKNNKLFRQRNQKAYEKLLSVNTDQILGLRHDCDTIKQAYRYVKYNKYTQKLEEELKKLLVEYEGDLKKISDGKPEFDYKKIFTDTASFFKICRSLYTDKLTKIKASVAQIEQECEAWRESNQQGLNFGPHPIPLLSEIDDEMERISPLANKDSAIRETIFPFYNEMTYYRDSKYYNAWYDDNIGTLLIVVERRKE